jgi:hypothetical protein
MSAFGGKADMWCVVTCRAATEERNTPYTYVQFTNLPDRLSLAVISFLGQKAMDFFERWFGFSGGRGDGSLEVLSLVVLGMITLIAMMRFVGK